MSHQNPTLEKGGKGGFDKTKGNAMLAYEKALKPLSRNLRSNMTDAETMLWSRLRSRQIRGKQFYRQKIIGEYIADFYCPKSKLVIEVDGGQHYTEEGKEKDRQRDEQMTEVGVRVLRFSDRDVLENIDAVMEKIWSEVS